MTTETDIVPELHDSNFTSALLDAQHMHKSIKVYTRDSGQRSFSTILGFDYFESSLLVEGFTPPVNMSAVSSLETQPFWIQMKNEDGFLNVLCILKERHYDLYTLKIITYEFSDNQRWFSRIHFEERNGPDFTFNIPFDIPLKAHIKDLSVHGAAVELYGEDVRERFLSLRRCKCKLQFNELFGIPLEAEIKQVNYSRKPSCHTRIRLMFKDLAPVSYVQLENFIDAFNNTDERISPSNKMRLSAAHFA